MGRPKTNPGWGGKGKEPKEPYIDIATVPRLSKGAIRKKFEALVQEHRDLTDQEAAAKKRKAEIKDELIPLMIAAKHDRIQVGNRRVLKYQGKNSVISGRKLLENGVPSDVIVKSTVVTPYDAIRVDVVPEDEGLVDE